ncbi:beta-N-acetylhexosaminidase [Aureimonas sp. AU4]|uniref:beta-N-acetylhexosaminidase n=1 Tax=Aureimonas sp. AU4 TaxID=1638163 RepID=UPI000780BBCD|nr:beta-N-acetylhexosaminidase [Aureimonas sp. AU4]
MSSSKSWIAGCSGWSLTSDERAFFRDERPWGFILFGRNIGEAEQVRELVAELKEIGGRETVPVLVDQEGGRVQRLRPPLSPRMPPSAEIGRVYAASREDGLRAAWLQGRLLAVDLLDGYGINVDCIPCLDVLQPGAHSVIGDRSYAHDGASVAALGGAAAEGLSAGGMLPVMKHLPGHGRSEVDSHLELPRVTASVEALRHDDFVPFQARRTLPAGMTAHLLFEAIDPERPATLSPKIISEVIRGELGFDGLLMTDDMSMKALQGEIGELAGRAIAAGCDLALHCNGDMAEMRSVAAAVPELSGRSLERAERALDIVRAGPTSRGDAAAWRAEFEALFGRVS